jgi:hypothetical protein
MPKLTYTRNIAASKSRYRRIRTEQKDGYVRITTQAEGTVTLEIDLDALFNTVGCRAVLNKGRRAGLGNGMIVAKAHSVKIKVEETNG